MTPKILSTICLSYWYPAGLPPKFRTYPFVFVVGKADVEIAPNIASCSLTLRAREQDPAEAAAIVEDRLKAY